MKIPRPTLTLASVVAGATVLAAVPVAWATVGHSAEVWLLVGLLGLASFGIAYATLHIAVYSRVEKLYDRVLAIRQKRLPDSSAARQPDPIYGIGRTILELTGTLRHELAEMKEAELVRKEFIGDISHELKTPIFAIQGFLETLLDGALEDENVNRKFLEKALNNALRLNNLVQDLLVVTQLEAGQLRMDFRPFVLYELVLDVVENIYQTGADLGIVLAQIEVWPEVPEKTQVLADRNRISQVLTNLLDNALKYGNPTDNVVVRIGQHGEKLLVSVCDTGQGIPEADQPYIFERFYRVDKSRSRNLGGNGLGLAIAKNLVMAHEESISVQSRPGNTVFSFTLTPTEG